MLTTKPDHISDEIWEFAKLFQNVDEHWKRTQPPDRYPTSLTAALKFLELDPITQLTEYKYMMFRLNQLKFWLDTMDNYVIT